MAFRVAPFACRNVLNIGFVLTKLSTRFTEFKVAMDSLFYHRSCPINLHFAVDDTSKKWITAYFDMREHEEITYTFYPITTSSKIGKVMAIGTFRNAEVYLFLF